MQDNPSDDAPEGFVLYRTRGQAPGRSDSHWLGRGEAQSLALYLPARVKDALELQKKQAAEQALAADEADQADKADKADKAGRAGKADSLPTSVLPSPSELAPVDEPEPPGAALALAHDPARQHPVYSLEAARELAGRGTLLGPDKEVRRRDEALGNRLLEAGVLRSTAIPEGALAALEALGQSQAHFAAVIALVRDQLVLARRSASDLRLPPMLLSGEPGLGKTHFAQALGQALGTSVRRIGFDAAITGATLLGSERRWSNTSPGALFELVCLGSHANPVVILDELDKAEVGRDWSPLSPLHTLLEPSTAAQARDISVNFEFDASRVIWIATCNDSRRIPETLRSRFAHFEIGRLEARGAIESSRAVLAAVFERLALSDFEPPGRAVAVALAHLTAREVRQAAEQALARAVSSGRRRLMVQDIDPRFLGEGSGGPAGPWLH